jgi:hypothetical protein
MIDFSYNYDISIGGLKMLHLIKSIKSEMSLGVFVDLPMLMAPTQDNISDVTVT